MSKVAIPARVLIAASMFASRWHGGPTRGIRIAWDGEGGWEVDATDSYRALVAWGESRAGKGGEEIVMDRSALLRLTSGDGTVVLDTDACAFEAGSARFEPYTQRFATLPGRFPDIGKLLGRGEDAVPGYPGLLAPSKLESFCEASKVLIPESAYRAMAMSHAKRPDADPEEPVMAFIDWPCLHRTQGFHAQGILAPMRQPMDGCLMATTRRSHEGIRSGLL